MNTFVKNRFTTLACLMFMSIVGPFSTLAMADGLSSAAAVPTMRNQANAIQRSAQQSTQQALGLGKTAKFTVKTPERFHEMGLAGVSVGDTLTATNLGQGKWRIADPSTGESVVYTRNH